MYVYYLNEYITTAINRPYLIQCMTKCILCTGCPKTHGITYYTDYVIWSQAPKGVMALVVTVVPIIIIILLWESMPVCGKVMKFGTLIEDNSTINQNNHSKCI